MKKNPSPKKVQKKISVKDLKRLKGGDSSVRGGKNQFVEVSYHYVPNKPSTN